MGAYTTEWKNTDFYIIYMFTQAGGVTRKDIQSIGYSWGEINFEYRPMTRDLSFNEIAATVPAKSYAIDIEPDDIAVSDTVTVIWEIA